MSKIANSIRRGLEEAVAYAQGEADKRRYRVHAPRRPSRQRWRSRTVRKA